MSWGMNASSNTMEDHIIVVVKEGFIAKCPLGDFIAYKILRFLQNFLFNL